MKLFNSVRGLRNNNPGNIERNATRWEGMSVEQSDPRFVVFESPEYGIRAMTRILNSYRNRGVITLGDIIRTWAPPVENQTWSYIGHVSSMTGIAATDPVPPARYPDLIKAIIAHENGLQPYSDFLIQRGVTMA